LHLVCILIKQQYNLELEKPFPPFNKLIKKTYSFKKKHGKWIFLMKRTKLTRFIRKDLQNFSKNILVRKRKRPSGWGLLLKFNHQEKAQ
jgi:hypothetical protein